MKKIVVVGSSNIDLIMKMDRIPEIGETVTGARFFQVYGGKGANQAVAASRAGGEVAFVSCVGDDDSTPAMIENYKSDGIDTSCVSQKNGIASGHALIMIDKNGENCISVASGANDLLTPTEIDAALPLLKSASIVVMQYEIPEDTIKYIIDVANANAIPVMWNMAPVKEFDRDYIPKINILVLNEIEAGYLSQMQVRNETEAKEAGLKLVELGVETVIVTLGSKGALAIQKGEQVFVPSFKVKAVDTTAAGDTFCGCFAVACVEGKSLQEALQFAGAGAAISVTRLGAQPSAPTRNEIETFLKEKEDV